METIRIITQLDQPVILIRREATMPQMAGIMGRSYRRPLAFLEQSGDAPT